MSMAKPDLRWIRLRESGPEAGDLKFAEEPFPPRAPGELTSLISAVRIQGVLSPILVRVVNSSYQIVCGYRRYLAAKEAGLAEIPAMVADLKDAEAIRCYLSESIIRRPMSPSAQEEMLKTLKRLRDSSPGADEGLFDRDESLPDRRLLAGRNQVLPVPPPSRIQLIEEPSAQDLVERMESFLVEVRTARSINVWEADFLTDAVLRLPPEKATVNPQRLPSGKPGDFTASHSILVAALCARIAKRLDWRRKRSRTLVLAALLHDVGMVFLKDRTSYQRPEVLRRNERSRLKSHTTVGCALITSARAFEDEVALSARDHHERWDGSGYPAGRLGDEVCFPARLIGLLDVYAALISPRPHRLPFEPAVALEEVSSAVERGLFDPTLLPLVRGDLERTLALH